MKNSEFQGWMRSGFINVEAELAHEIIRPKPYVSEERVRSAMLDGLAISRGREADRIGVERDATFSSRPCWHNRTHGAATGRPIQHDIWIDAKDGDGGLACEVKWLKVANGASLAKDILKLALARGIVAEQQALRT